MSNYKVSIVFIDKSYKQSLAEIIYLEPNCSWFYLGRNSVVAYELENSVLKNNYRINISKKLSDSQYKNRDAYIDFIDHFEKNTGKSSWWSSYLSCKNPWISNFFLRFCQLDVCTEIIDEYSNQSLLIVVDEHVVFDALKKNLEKQVDLNVHFYSKKVSKNLKLFVKGIVNRISSIPKGLLLKKKYINTFSKTFFDAESSEKDKLILFPTFIDQRSFRTGNYSDPFIGKVLNDRLIGGRMVVIIPIVVQASNAQLKLFDKWLIDNNYSVYFLPKALSIVKAALFILKYLKKEPNVSGGAILNKYDVSDLINYERQEEWSNFNLNSFYIEQFIKLISNNHHQIYCVYPFENQRWERHLVYELRKKNNAVIIGMQNAPSPLLSTRYFVASDLIDDIPLPDYIVATGEVSYSNLYNNYKGKVNILKSTSARVFKAFDIKRENSDVKNVMLACSIGRNESVELITLVASYLKNNNINNIDVNIVPHPLSNINFTELLVEIQSPLNLSISNTGFESELKRSDLILYDSSTVGLEGIMNHVQPVYIGHECSVHVNPNEFDKQLTKYVYSKEEFLNVINASVNHKLDYQRISLKYFGDQSKLDVSNVLYNILNKNKEVINN